MQRLSDDLSQIRGDLGKLLARYELNLPEGHRGTLKADELYRMLELLDATRARLGSIACLVTAQLEIRRAATPTRREPLDSVQYETVAEVSTRTKITKPKLYNLLNAGEIPGAQQVGHEWRIPTSWPASLPEN